MTFAEIISAVTEVISSIRKSSQAQCMMALVLIGLAVWAAVEVTTYKNCLEVQVCKIPCIESKLEAQQKVIDSVGPMAQEVHEMRIFLMGGRRASK